MKDLPKSRKEAKAVNSIHYFTGKECANGHIDIRFTGAGTCIQCARERDKRRSEAGYYTEYLEKNKERIQEKSKKQYQKNKDRILETVKKFAENNKERVKAYKSKNKAIRKGVDIKDESKDIAAWLESVEKTCFWCGCDCEHDYQMDHFYPLSKGGDHALTNLVISCPTCNFNKRAKDPYEYAKEIGKKLPSKMGSRA